MAKKAKSINKLLALVGALLAIVAVVMIFLPQIVEASGDNTYNGLVLAFGKEYKTGLSGIAEASRTINFSFPNLLAYILVVAGLVINVLQFVGIGKSKLMTFIAGAALVAGGILFFFALNFSTITTSGNVLGIGGSTTSKFADFNTDNVTVYKLGYGAIVGGITAIVSGVCALGNAVLSK